MLRSESNQLEENLSAFRHVQIVIGKDDAKGNGHRRRASQ